MTYKTPYLFPENTVNLLLKQSKFAQITQIRKEGLFSVNEVKIFVVVTKNERPIMDPLPGLKIYTFLMRFFKLSTNDIKVCIKSYGYLNYKIIINLGLHLFFLHFESFQ